MPVTTKVDSVAMLDLGSFSLRKREPDDPKDAAVWMLDPEWLNDITLAKVYGEEQDEMTGVLLPEWKDTNKWFPKPFEGAPAGG
jgi:hypothetical protein